MSCDIDYAAYESQRGWSHHAPSVRGSKKKRKRVILLYSCIEQHCKLMRRMCFARKLCHFTGKCGGFAFALLFFAFSTLFSSPNMINQLWLCFQLHSEAAVSHSGCVGKGNHTAWVCVHAAVRLTAFLSQNSNTHCCMLKTTFFYNCTINIRPVGHGLWLVFNWLELVV